MYDSVVVGAGFCGSVIARFLAEEMNKKVLVVERRNHIAGNMYDFKDENDILTQQYGPHTFHTNKKEIYDYINRFGEWIPYELRCMACIDGKFTPSPFNFQTIDDFYSEEEAKEIKEHIKEYYKDQDKTTIVEMLNCSDDVIRKYANFLYEKDYSLYTAKQWGISPEDIDISVLNRVPVLFSYKEGYFEDTYQVMPKYGFTKFFENMLNHPNITIQLETDAVEYIKLDIENKKITFGEESPDVPIIYTGPLDQLLSYKYGILPYRSLRFEYKTLNMKSFQDAPVVAYPQAKDYTRITEYTKIPIQDKDITKIAIEYPLQYNLGENTEPYYPILTTENIVSYNKYKSELENIDNLFICGRLAEFKYYNMDQALERALSMCDIIKEWFITKR